MEIRRRVPHGAGAPGHLPGICSEEIGDGRFENSRAKEIIAHCRSDVVSAIKLRVASHLCNRF
jgi:hypothetical protein